MYWIGPAGAEQDAGPGTDFDAIRRGYVSITPIHVDQEYARQTPFGKPIAHGLLGLSFLAGLSTHSPAVQTFAFIGLHDWKFRKPIFIGDRISVTISVTDMRPTSKPDRGILTLKFDVANQHGETVQQGINKLMVYR